jgi:cyanophycin synthetase
MNIRRVVALAGPNIWTNYKALEAWVDIGKFEDFPSNKLPGFSDRIMAWLPSMVEHRCGIGERGGFFQRLRTGTYLGHILEHVTIELQTLAGVPVEFGRARETSERGVYKVVIEFTEEQFARAAMETARSLILAAVDDTAFDVGEAVTKLQRLADEVCLGPGTRSIIKAAADRNIPFLRLNTGSLVQLGYCSAQRRIWAAETDRTSAVAESIAQDKQLTRQLLEAVGVPVPKGRTVASKDDAWKAAQEIGLPVVIKPQDGNYGRGVSIDLRDEESIRAAFDCADREGSGVVAESMIRGLPHRVLVVKDKVVAASRGDFDHVFGDGVHTIVELVEETNRQSLRGTGQEYPLSTLLLDNIALGLLARQGFSSTSIPPQGHQVVIHYNGDLTDDVTEEVHPDVAADCVLAARAVGLNIAGIDLIANRIDQPLAAQGGAVVEVNASPGLLMHLRPMNGKPRPVGTAVVSALFEEHKAGRVPIIAVTGTNGKTSTVKLLRHILKCAGKKLGATSSEGIYIGSRRIQDGDCTDAPSARRILVNPFVDAAVFEISGNSVLNQGLAFDQCDVAVVTNVGSADHLGAQYVETVEVMTKAKRTPVDVVTPSGACVLNADDSVVAGLSSYCPGSTIFFSLSIRNSSVKDLLAAGHRVVTLDRGSVELVDGGKQTSLIPVSALPFTLNGQLEFQIQNSLAAVGAAWALGIGSSHIAAGLTQAAAHETSCHGYYELGGATVLLTQCRNLSALNATISAIGLVGNFAKRVAVYGVQSDHRLVDAYEQGARLGQFFDRVMLGCYFDPSSEDRRSLLEEIERGVRSAAHAHDVTQASHSLGDSRLARQIIQSLEPKDVLMLQVKDAAGMAAARSLLLERGAKSLTGGPGTGVLAAVRESSQPLPSSNNV